MRGRPTAYQRVLPSADDGLLLMEIANSSLAYDTGEKAALHAAAAMVDDCVIHIPDHCVDVYRQPAGGRS